MITVTTTVFKKTTLALIGLACTAGVVLSIGLNPAKQETVVNAASDPDATTERVYLATDSGRSWFTGNGTYDMYAYYFNGASIAWPGVKMTKILSSLSTSNSQPLYYADIPNSADSIVFNNNGATSNGSGQTVDITIGTFVDSYFFKVTWQWSDDGSANKNKTGGDFTGLTFLTSEFGSILSSYDSCSASSTTGYGAVPSLDYYYASHTTIDSSTAIMDWAYGNTAHAGSKTLEVKVSEKWAAMKYSYNPLYSAANIPSSNSEKDLWPIFFIGLIGLTAVASYYIISRKKHLA